MAFCSFEFNFVTFIDVSNKECKDVFSLKFKMIGIFFVWPMPGGGMLRLFSYFGLLCELALNLRYRYEVRSKLASVL